MKLSSTIRVAVGTTLAVQSSYFMKKLMDEEHSFIPGGYEDMFQRRLMNSNNGDIHKNEHFFFNKDGLRIFWRHWLPDPQHHQQIKGLIILCHAEGSHSGRFEHLAQSLANSGMAVYALDQQGHGQSEGDRLYVKWFCDYVADTMVLTEIAKKKHTNVSNLYILGHSMGALIAVQVARTTPRLWNGVILSAPRFTIDPIFQSENTRSMLTVASGAFPKLGLKSIGIDSFSRSEEVLDRYLNDPLVSHNRIPARLLGEIYAQIDDIFMCADKITFPFLILHGSGDTICPIGASEKFYNLAGSLDIGKNLVLFEGACHDLFNNPETKDLVVNEVRSWIGGL